MSDGKLNLEKLVNKIHTKDSIKFMKRLPDKSIDFCMTSTPYWQLRDYGIKDQIGQEKTPEEYIWNLVAVFRELKRILNETGSFYLNLGDTYVGTDNCSRKSWKKVKQLALIPSRVAIALQEDGWILRNDICWHKPNGLPSSVKDRLTNRWEHIFHFVKQRKYYYNLDAIREPQKKNSIKRVMYRMKLQARTGRPMTEKSKYFNEEAGKFGMSGFLTGRSLKSVLNLKGKNPGDVWNITVKPLSVPHFAVYPEEVCIRPIKSSCPPGGIVFDPFAGSGTTLVAAKKLGIRFIGCDLNPGYVKLANERLGGIGKNHA
jgi:DNA modification methylase